MPQVMAGETDTTARQLHDELLPQLPSGSHDTAACPFCTPSRETAAAEGARMAEGTSTSTIDLDNPAITAIVNDRVARETAELRQRAETAESERDGARNRVDVLEAEKVAAEQAATTAQNELASFRTEVENERASTNRREARKTALREVAAHLSDDWFGAEVKEGEHTITRLDRIARMADDAFESYKSEIASAFAGVTVAPVDGAGSTTVVPRETAAAGNGGGPSQGGTGGQGGTGSKSSAASSFIGSVGYGGVRRPAKV